MKWYWVPFHAIELEGFLAISRGLSVATPPVQGSEITPPRTRRVRSQSLQGFALPDRSLWCETTRRKRCRLLASAGPNVTEHAVRPAPTTGCGAAYYEAQIIAGIRSALVSRNLDRYSTHAYTTHLHSPPFIRRGRARWLRRMSLGVCRIARPLPKGAQPVSRIPHGHYLPIQPFR